jgi:hypothetical protein
MPGKAENQKKIRNAIEDYEQTVNALLAFTAFIVHDGIKFRPESNFGFGRRMATSKVNSSQPNKEVTPDLVAQKSLKYGIVAEAKKSLSRDTDQWKRHIDQLRKYDDELTGWWTPDEKIQQADTLMLIHQSRSRQFARYINKSMQDDPKSVGSNTGVVEFNRADEASPYYFFRGEHGSLRDYELKTKLDDGIQIPLAKVIESFPNIRYYDAPPHLVIILEHLWTEFFPSMLEKGIFDERIRATRINVSVDEITHEMQQAYGSGALSQDSRSSEFPSKKRIREAFDRLVRFKLATPPTRGDDGYVVFYRNLRGDVRERFINMEVNLLAKEIVDPERQIALL